MPTGLPQPSALSSRKACAFALDTSVIEEAAFRFNDGALKHLSRQLPPWLELWMPDIIKREIRQHRIDHVSRSVQQIHNGMQELHRHIGKDFNQEKPEWLSTATDTAFGVFDGQLERFLKSHNGLILEPDHARLSVELFNRYFQGNPPFGGGKDKKHEFPDGASLLMLEFMAVTRGVQVIAVSKDGGWKAYADKSAHIYCVSSLSELTALFMSHTVEAKVIQKRLSEVFSSPKGDLKGSLKSAIDVGLRSLPWRIRLPHSYRLEFDAAIIGTKLNTFELRHEEVGLWITSQKNDACVAQLPIDIDASFRVEITSYCYDRNGEKIDMLNAELIIDQRFEVMLLLEMTGDLECAHPLELIKNMSLGDSPIDVVIGLDKLHSDWVTQNWGFAFDEIDSDIPF